ncbi:hypothetical protein IKL64_03765 [bacterium]|nr:hypothetical protein [bacterium]
MNFFGYDIDFTSKEFWATAIAFVAFCSWCYFFKVESDIFECNPRICQVSNLSANGRTISKQNIDIKNVEYFSLQDYYSQFEGASNRRHRHRYTIYVTNKNGETYRFFKSSLTTEQTAQGIVNELNSYLPTTQDKANIYIKF